jgi:glycosyltransferase involved in cell wall biosynthesis
MKILILNYEFPPIGGGGGIAILQLLKRFAGRENLYIDVLTSAAKPGLKQERFAENINIYKVGIHKKDLHLWKRAEVIEWLIKAGSLYKKLLHEKDYKLAHAFFGFPTGRLCYRNAGKLPYIISLRGSDVPGINTRLKFDYKILAPVFRAIWKKADLLVACSKGLKERALRFMPSANIEVIPNGIDLDVFNPSRVHEKSETLRLVTVGRLSATKRVEMLIDTVELLHKQGTKTHFKIVGGGKMELQLKTIISQKGLGDIIEITGRIDSKDMPEIYRRSDVFISASMQEGMSNAMLEAMASALPIITTSCEGVEELVKDNGIVVKEDFAESIANAVKLLASDEKLYNKMKSAALKQAEKFSWENAAEQYIGIYKTVAERR